MRTWRLSVNDDWTQATTQATDIDYHWFSSFGHGWREIATFDAPDVEAAGEITKTWITWGRDSSAPHGYRYRLADGRTLNGSSEGNN